MSSVLRVLGWTAEGLRCPDHVIDCCDENGSPSAVTLIQMPNGTGKTTTLHLLRAAISGSAQGVEWTSERIMEFKKRDNATDSGKFELRLLLNDRPVTIILIFDFSSGRISYRTTKGKGQALGFEPPVEFRRFMNENFVHFFVFDGELAEHLLDSKRTDAEAVVECLFQLNVLKTISQKVEEYWESRTKRASATEERGLARRKNRLDALRERHRTLKQNHDRIKKTHEEKAEELKKWRARYDTQLSGEKTRAHSIQVAHDRVRDLEAQIDKRAEGILDRMRDPHALTSVFAEKMHGLKSGLDRVKLPESAAKEFFEELSLEAECVCGRPIDEHVSEVIRSRAQKYLGSEDVALLNSMKSTVDNAVGPSRDGPEKLLTSALEQIGGLDGQLRDAKTQLDQLKLEAEQADPKVKEASDVIRGLEAKLSELNDDLQVFENKDDSLPDEKTFGLEVLRRRIDDAEKKVGEIAQTLELREKRDVLVKILRDAHQRASRAIGEELRKEANERIQKLMPGNNISIESIGRSLVLKNQSGGSVGETLSIGYAFLSTLFDRAEHQLPFIVDSPAGPIDLEVRPRIGELVPKLSRQFVAFTISSERASFLDGLVRATNNVKFLTLFRKGSEELERTARRVGKYRETSDGILVEGKEFFSLFQVEKEEG